MLESGHLLCFFCRKANFSRAIIQGRIQYRLLCTVASRSRSWSLVAPPRRSFNNVPLAAKTNSKHSFLNSRTSNAGVLASLVQIRSFGVSKTRTAVKQNKKSRTLKSYTPDWSLKCISILCCEELYMPKPEGIQLEVDYVDTASHLSVDERASMPTVLVTHDSPGSHEDMMGIAQPLADKGFRVVLPNYPGWFLQY